MKNIVKKRLVYRFFLFILPLIVLSIITTSVILSSVSFIYSQKTIRQNYDNILRSSSNEIHMYISNAQNSMTNLALLMTATKMDKWQKEIALTAFLHTNSQFLSVSILSAEGEEIIPTITNENEQIGFHEETFQKALSGHDSVSGVMLTEDDIPHTCIAIPLKHLGGITEVLWGKLSLKSVWDVLEGIKIGQTGQVYIMDLSGRYLAHREIDRVVRTPPAEKPNILTELRKTNTTVDWIEKKEHIKNYCLGSYIADLNWIIVLSQDLSEIYSYIYLNIYLAVIVTCLICIIAILLGWNWIRRLLSPIQSLHHQVKLIGNGDLDHKVTIDSQDEIGDLGLAFNDMTDSLKKYIHREVETTRELIHARSLAALGTVYSKVTHEMGNFLGNVGMSLSILKSESFSNRGEKAVGILEKELSRIKAFIHNFLQLAKKPDLKLQKMPLKHIINDVLDVYQADKKRQDVCLNFIWPDEIPPINVDPGLMSRALNNIIKNSMEAIVDSGEITIRGKKEADCVLITIEDTGPGIDPDIIEQIFDPFFTTKGKKGTGLGMSITKTIIEAHGGTIACKSTLQKNTTFFLRIPL